MWEIPVTSNKTVDRANDFPEAQLVDIKDEMCHTSSVGAKKVVSQPISWWIFLRHSMKHMYLMKIGQMGVKLLLLVDGNGSRFKLPFLRYISDEAHEWTVVTRVPYGTALW